MDIHNLPKFIMINDRKNYQNLMVYFQTIGIKWGSGVLATEMNIVKAFEDKGIIIRLSDNSFTSSKIKMTYSSVGEISLLCDYGYLDYDDKYIGRLEQHSKIEKPRIVKMISPSEVIDYYGL